MTTLLLKNDQERVKTLRRSAFRSRFKLDAKDLEYIYSRGFELMRTHANDFIRLKLAPAQPKNDGKQTPFRGHPVFKAQHATATCCRGCLKKWYAIEKDRILKVDEIQAIVHVIMHWLERQFQKKEIIPCKK